MVHDVLGAAADEELDRPAPSRVALGVVGTDGLEIGLSMRGEAVRSHDSVERGPNLDLPRVLVGFVDIDMADDLVATTAGTARPWAELTGRAGRDVVEVGPARLQELEATAAERTSRSIGDGTWATPQKSVELEPGTRSTTSISRARAKAAFMPARWATPVYRGT